VLQAACRAVGSVVFYNAGIYSGVVANGANQVPSARSISLPRNASKAFVTLWCSKYGRIAYRNNPPANFA
jgi:hypothetical protein